MKILPLRNMVLVRYIENGHRSPLQVVETPRSIRQAMVLAVGPECREVQAEMQVLVQSTAATQIGAEALVPESAIVGVL